MKRDYIIGAAIFFVIILIKIYLSLRFHTPFIFQDEYSYSYVANDILSNPTHFIVQSTQYPSGYPLLFIPSFIAFYPNMEHIYRSILITNIILSTLVFPISYLILRKFVNNYIVIFGSLLIVLLPSNVLYNFLIFSENLYIPLYVLSGYLILKSFEKNDRLLHIFTGFIIFYLSLIRAFGILALISFFIVIFYKILTDKKIDFLRKNSYLICTPIILISVWTLSKIIYNSSLYGYNSDGYLQSILYIFSDVQNFILFLRLMIHEIDYLMITSYFIFFIFSVSILLCWDKLEQPVKVYILYSSVYTLLSLILTVLHMMNYVKNPDDPQYMSYFMFGRYIDPILPTIFIIGLISWKLLRDIDFDFNNIKFIFATSLMVLISMITYPYYMSYKIVNVMSIYYIKDMDLYYLYALSIILLTISLTLIKRPKILIVLLIIFSLIVSISPYKWLESASNRAETMNSIGGLLSTKEMRNESILVDNETFVYTTTTIYSIATYNMRSEILTPSYIDYFLIKFWTMPNNLIYRNIDNGLKDEKYIISRKALPYEVVSISPNNILYKSKISENIQLIPTIGFYNLKYNTNNISDAWMENNAILYIYVPDENMTNSSLIFDINSFYRPRNLQIYADNKLIYNDQISTDNVKIRADLNLRQGDNFVRFYTPDVCQRPIDVIGNEDPRCISLYFKYISLKY